MRDLALQAAGVLAILVAIVHAAIGELRVFARPKAGFSGVGGIVTATLPLSPFPFEPNYRVLVETLAHHQKRRALIVVLTDFVEIDSLGRTLEQYPQRRPQQLDGGLDHEADHHQ